MDRQMSSSAPQKGAQWKGAGRRRKGLQIAGNPEWILMLMLILWGWPCIKLSASQPAVKTDTTNYQTGSPPQNYHQPLKSTPDFRQSLTLFYALQLCSFSLRTAANEWMIVNETKIKILLNAVQNLKYKNIFSFMWVVSSPKKQQIQRLKNHEKIFFGFKKG